MNNQVRDERDTTYEKNKSMARGFSTAVYIGGVIAASMLFISFILLAFPADAYFTRVIMSVAGMMVGGSMLAFPYALHNWAITKEHRKWTTILYYVEMLIIGVNTVVSFVSLLAKFSGYAAPEWVVLYEPFSVASIIYTIFAWGSVFLLDPDHKLQADERDADARFAKKLAAKREEFIDSVEGEDLIVKIATEDIQDRFAPARYNNGRKHFGSREVAVNPEVGFVPKQATTQAEQITPMEPRP
jgi:hypothetical protein